MSEVGEFSCQFDGSALDTGRAAATRHAAPACAHPNVNATLLHSVEPATPPVARQQGIGGAVQVVVSLDAESHIVGTRIQTSPSAILNAPALAAARESTFQTEIRDCKPVPSEYIFTVDFTG